MCGTIPPLPNTSSWCGASLSTETTYLSLGCKNKKDSAWKRLLSFIDTCSLGAYVCDLHSSMAVLLTQCWVKVKVQLSLCLTKYHAMKIYGGVEV
jgi:hypothetical protein